MGGTIGKLVFPNIPPSYGTDLPGLKVLDGHNILRKYGHKVDMCPPEVYIYKMGNSAAKINILFFHANACDVGHCRYELSAICQKVCTTFNFLFSVILSSNNC